MADDFGLTLTIHAIPVQSSDIVRAGLEPLVHCRRSEYYSGDDDTAE